MDDTKGRLLAGQESSFKNEDFESLKEVVDGENASHWSTRGTPMKSTRFLWYSLTIIVAALFLGGYVIYTEVRGSQAASAKEIQWRHCGNTSVEARANDCVLDFIPGAWVPRACYDAELEKEFLSLDQWQWFADEDYQNELTFASIKETGGPDPIYVSMKYHRQHCAYTWKKLHRAIIGHGPIDTHIGDYEHTVHCSEALAKPDMGTISTFYHIFSGCKMPGDFVMGEDTP